MFRVSTIFLITTLLLTAQSQVESTPLADADPLSPPEPTLMLIQNYIDFSDEALESDTLPNIVMITVMQLDSDESASAHLQYFVPGRDFDVTGTVTEMDDIGDEAVFVEDVDEGGDHSAWLVARDGDVVITAFVTGAPGAPEIAQDIVRFMVDHGPSDDELSVDVDGVATGGWADAYPAPDDIEGISHLEASPITDFRTIEGSPASSPEVSTPVS